MDKKEPKKLEVTKIEDITNGELVELPPFSNGKSLVARLKSPSIFMLCASGAIPDELLQEAQDIYEGKQLIPEKGKIKEYAKVMIAVAKATLIKPKYEEIEEYLNTRQLISIYNYAQMGVRALLPFREIQKLLKNVGTGKSDKQATKPDIKDKK